MDFSIEIFFYLDLNSYIWFSILIKNKIYGSNNDLS